jgi:hypothetical protein
MFRVMTPTYEVLFAITANGTLLAGTPEQHPRKMLRTGTNQKTTGKRTQAVRALRLLPCNPEATEMAETALLDRKPEVRAAAATALV